MSFQHLENLVMWKWETEQRIIAASGCRDTTNVLAWVKVCWERGTTSEYLSNTRESEFEALDLKIATGLVAMVAAAIKATEATCERHRKDGGGDKRNSAAVVSAYQIDGVARTLRNVIDAAQQGMGRSLKGRQALLIIAEMIIQT